MSSVHALLLAKLLAADRGGRHFVLAFDDDAPLKPFAVRPEQARLSPTLPSLLAPRADSVSSRRDSRIDYHPLQHLSPSERSWNSL